MERCIPTHSQWVSQQRGSVLPLRFDLHLIRLSWAHADVPPHACSFSRSDLHGPIRAKVREGCRKRLPEAQQGVLLLKVSNHIEARADAGHPC